MIAVILAGGLGTRMRQSYPLTPKVLLPVEGRPVIFHTIDFLISNSIKDCIVVLCNDAEHIKSAIITEYGSRINFNFIIESAPLGSGGIFYSQFWDSKSQYFIVLGDVYFDISMKRLLSVTSQADCDGFVFTHPNDHPQDSDLVVVASNDKILGVVKKEEPKVNYFNNSVIAGIFLFNGYALNKLRHLRKSADLSQQVIPDLLKMGANIQEYRTTEYIKDMGTPDRLRKVNFDVSQGTPSRRNLENRQVAVFLDRDGIINEKCGHISDWRNLKLKVGVAEFVGRLNKAGILAVCVTNQPVIARGEISEAEFIRTMIGRLDFLLSERGAYIDDFIYCPHHPDSGFDGEVSELKIECDCRKPAPGMLFFAQNKWNIDERASWLLGDRWVDIVAAQIFGCKTILVAESDEDIELDQCNPDFISSCIDAAADIVFNEIEVL